MARLITLGRGGALDADRILLIASARSAPIKRLLAMLDTNQIINLTYGYPRETVILLEGGIFVIVSQTIEDITQLLGSLRIDHHEKTFKQRPSRS